MKLVYLGNLEKFADELAKRVRELFVLKEGGKGLSSNDYTAEDKAKVANIPTDYIKTGLQTETSTADGGTNVYTLYGEHKRRGGERRGKRSDRSDRSSGAAREPMELRNGGDGERHDRCGVQRDRNHGRARE